MKKRFIFDLDGTLLTGDYTELNKYLVDLLGEGAIEFTSHMSQYLGRYEKMFMRYDYDVLSKYLIETTGLPMTPEVVEEWDHMVPYIKDTEEEHVRETLEYLKRNGNSLAVLTNWFGESQRERLQRAGLLEYFDAVYSGDIITKPHKEAYLYAAAGKDPKSCYFVGDNVDNDYIGPKACSMNSILYDKEDKHHKSLIKIKRLDELKKIK